ncbi:hypothetical protein BACCELL_04227 [Bacteroides cellulosilyticus DSM 14838]|uniref:Uncharacterized protein n=1 Tax=Bacteroides cellulosilyticus DSM 14838 TaxID=537012 RepID=E2NIU2_9BACE|nr:hypothetical protein BACCELL_04227 [Bacteroides cellulosilyticus DSM 14838]
MFILFLLIYYSRPAYSLSARKPLRNSSKAFEAIYKTYLLLYFLLFKLFLI